jgi:chorismate--pyruvate lyase
LTRSRTYSPTATCWKPHRRYLHAGIPPELVHWLLDPASLTLRLQQLCGAGFHVRVISQGWGRPRLDESQALGMAGRERAIIRQVRLMCADQPWIYARTVLPATSLRGKLQRLAHLGTRPLGAMLFADPGMQRGEVELARILPGRLAGMCLPSGDGARYFASTADRCWSARSSCPVSPAPGCSGPPGKCDPARGMCIALCSTTPPWH